MKKFLILLLTMTFAYSQAQEINIKGIVYNATNNEPVMGATVIVIGSNKKTITDIDGKFQISAGENAFLEISHPNYETKKVKAHKQMKIYLMTKQIQLDAVVIKANPLEDITHSVVVTDDIKKGSQPRNAADLFQDIPGFSMQKRSNTSLEPSLRAFKYEQMNIKINGGSKIVNACPNRMDPITAHVIPEEVSRIEVVKGPYTVRFGQTFGGVVNMVTKTPTAENFGWHGVLESGYETNGNNLAVRGEVQYAQKKYDISIDGEHRDFGDYTDGDGITIPAGFKTDSYSVKLGYNPKENQRLAINWHQKFGSEIKHAGLPMDSPKDDSYLLGVDYKIKKVSDKIHHISFKSYYSFVDHLMTNGYGMETPRPNYPAIDARSPVTSNTMGGKFEIGWTPKKDWLIYSGLDADIIKRDGNKHIVININPATGVPLNPPMVKDLKIWQDAQINDFGAFTEAHYKINDQYTATAGVRVDYVTAGINDPDPGYLAIYGGKVDDKTDITIGGTVSVKYKKDDLTAQFAYGRGTRTPSMIERYIYRFTVGEDGRDYIGNPNLRPEINNQFEVGAQLNKEKWAGGMNVYYSILQDYITPILVPALTAPGGGCGGGPPKAPKQFWNVQANQYGFEAFFNYQIIENLTFKSDIALTKAYNETLDEPLAQVAPMTSHLGLKYETDKYWIDFRSELVATQKDYAPSFGETETPGHTKLDLRLGYKPMKGLSVGAAVLNITDEAYYNHLNFAFKNADALNGRRIYEPGRSFSLYVKYRF